MSAGNRKLLFSILASSFCFANCCLLEYVPKNDEKALETVATIFDLLDKWPVASSTWFEQEENYNGYFHDDENQQKIKAHSSKDVERIYEKTTRGGSHYEVVIAQALVVHYTTAFARGFFYCYNDLAPLSQSCSQVAMYLSLFVSYPPIRGIFSRKFLNDILDSDELTDAVKNDARLFSETYLKNAEIIEKIFKESVSTENSFILNAVNKNLELQLPSDNYFCEFMAGILFGTRAPTEPIEPKPIEPIEHKPELYAWIKATYFKKTFYENNQGKILSSILRDLVMGKNKKAKGIEENDLSLYMVVKNEPNSEKSSNLRFAFLRRGKLQSPYGEEESDVPQFFPIQQQP